MTRAPIETAPIRRQFRSELGVGRCDTALLAGIRARLCDPDPRPGPHVPPDPGGGPPPAPPGIDPERWAAARTDGERKRLVREARG